MLGKSTKGSKARGYQMSKEQPIDVRDMAIIHRTFRAGYAEAARLVRAASTPSPRRVKFLADHIDLAIAALHIHHESEDELLYPKLIQRAPEQAPMTEEVEHEHQLIRTALDTASAACATWREQPSAETAEALAAALDQLNAVAQRHLDDEEQNVVPLAAVTLTQQEWDALGKHGLAQIPRNKRRIAFGMILDPLDEADRAYMKGFLPAPVRMLYPFLIERPWKKYASTLRTGS
jgi:hemerythrin-like domain-containing protein